MATLSPCPPAERLRQLLAGDPPNAEQAELIAHLDDCPACQHALEALAGADPALLRVAHSLQRSRYTEEAPLRRVLDHLERDATLSRLCASQAGTPALHSLLRPVAST